MKVFKKSLAVIIAFIMTFSSFTVAFAADGEKNIVTITMSYELQSVNRFIKALDTAKITINVENTCNQDLTGVVVAADSDRLYLKKGETGVFEVGTLKAGESAEYSFNTMICPKDKSLTIIDKVALFFGYLLRKPVAFEKVSYSEITKRYCSENLNVTIAGKDAEVSATCWWDRFEFNKKAEITFDTGDGTPVDSITVAKGTEPGKLPESSLKGYTFSGWFEDKEFTKPFCENTIVDKDITVYALFIENSEEVKENAVTEYYVEDCPTDYKVTLLCADEITQQNLFEHISMEDGYGSVPEVTVTQKGDNEYEIGPAAEYEPAWQYTITAYEGVNFKGVEETVYKYSFRIHKDDVMLAERNKDIIYINRNEVTELSTENNYLIPVDLFEKYNIKTGDTICIGSGKNEDDYDCVYLNIRETVRNGVDTIIDGNENGGDAEGGSYILVCDNAAPEDVYDDVDIYFEQDLKNELFTEEEEQAIANELRSGDAIRQVNTMAALYLLSSPSFIEMGKESLDLKLGAAPDYGENAYINTDNVQTLTNKFNNLVNIEVKIGGAGQVVNNNFTNPNPDNWTGIEFRFKYEGNINTKLKVNAIFTFKQYINVSLQGYSSVKIKLFAKDHLDFDYAVNCYTQTTLGVNVLIGSTNAGEEMKDITEEIEKFVNSDDDGADSIVKQMQEMLDTDSAYIELVKINLFKLRQPVLAVLQVNLDLDFVVKVKFAAGIGIEYTTLDAVQIGFRGNTSTGEFGSYRNSLVGADRYDFRLTVCGYLGFKVGIEGSVSISFIGLKDLGEVGVSVEFGVYLDIYGYAQYRVYKTNKYYSPQSSLKGGIYVELGLYIEVSLFARSNWLKAEASSTLLDKKFPLASIGNKYLFVSLNKPENDIVFTGSRVGADKLKKLTGKFMDMTTGEIEEEMPIDWTDLSIYFASENFGAERDYKDNNKLLAITHSQRVWYQKDIYNIHAEETTAYISYIGQKLNTGSNTVTARVAFTDGKYVAPENIGKKFNVRIYEVIDGVSTLLSEREVEAGKVAAAYTEFPIDSEKYIAEWDADPAQTIVTKNMTFTRTGIHPQRKVAYIYLDEKGENWVAEVRVLDGNDEPAFDAPKQPGKEFISQWIDSPGEGDCYYPSGVGFVCLDLKTFINHYGMSRIFHGLDKNATLLKITCPRNENIKEIFREDYGEIWSELAYTYTARYAVGSCDVTINYKDWDGNDQTYETVKKNGQPLSYVSACPKGYELDYYKNDKTGENCGKSLVYTEITDDASFTAVYKPATYSLEVNYWDEKSQSWQKDTITTVGGKINTADLKKYEDKATAEATGVETTVKRWEYYYSEGGCRYNYTPESVIYANAKIKMVICREVAITYDLNGGDSKVLNSEKAYSLLDYEVNVGYAGRNNTDDVNYTFAGWLDESTGKLYGEGETARFTSPTTLVAQWIDADSEYTIMLSSGYWPLKGETENYKVYTVKSSEVDAFVEQLKQEYAAYTPDDVVNAGYIYHFTGELIEQRSYRSIGLALKTETSPVEYKVTWIFGNGKDDVVENFPYGTTFTSLSEYTKAADAEATYEFGGWDTDGDGVADHQAGESYTLTGDTTLRVIWIPTYKSYSVKFRVDGNDIGITEYHFVKDNVSVPDKYVREGYDVSDWTSEDVTITEGKYIMPANDITLTATTSSKLYKVTYNVNGSFWKEETHLCGSMVTAPVPTAPDGKMFTGWTSEDVTVNIRTFTMPASGVVLNANFSTRPEDKIMVIYYIDGMFYESDVASPGESLTVPSEIDTGKVIGDVTGKVFSGWGSDYIDLTEGYFTLNETNGSVFKIYGTFTDSSAEKLVNLYIGSDENARLFWRLHLNSGTQYELPVFGSITGWIGQGVENNILTVPENAEKLNVFAITEAKRRTIKFDNSNGNTRIGPDQEYFYSVQATVGSKYYLPEVTVASYSPGTPSEWATLSDVKIESDENGKYIIVPDEDITLSCWEILDTDDSYPVTLQILLPSGETFDFGTMVDRYGIYLPIPQLSGYTFDDWYYEGEKTDGFVYVTGDMTLTGKFVPDETRIGNYYLDGDKIFTGIYKVNGDNLRLIEPDVGMPEFNVNTQYIPGVSLEVACYEDTELDDFIRYVEILNMNTFYMEEAPYNDFSISFITARENGSVFIKCDRPYLIYNYFNPDDTIYLPATSDENYIVSYSVNWCVWSDAEGTYEKIPNGEITVSECSCGYKFTVPAVPQENAAIIITAEIAAN